MFSQIWPLYAASALLAAVARGQEVTVGPVAPVSLGERIEWSTARECAAACLKYNGIWVCGNHGGYYDLGVELECGCASINGCYCNTELASSASSYISACVSSRCSAVDDLTRDLSNMIGLYDSYCETARAEGASGENAPRPVDDGEKDAETTGETVTKKTGESNDLPKQTSSAGAESTATEGESQENTKSSEEGLSRSDIVALAASLGVGIPSLLIAALTLYFQIRKKRRNAQANAARTNSMIHVMPVKQTRNGWDH